MFIAYLVGTCLPWLWFPTPLTVRSRNAIPETRQKPAGCSPIDLHDSRPDSPTSHIMKYYPRARIFGAFTLLVAKTSANNINDDKSNGSPSDSKFTRDSTTPWPCPYYHEMTFSDHQSIQYTVYCESLILG
ncbi:uncharacterized protein K489DRAFT_51497 [Dissoconium aciculare CBS 342.82]|uniref:Uncharacterized protein n=1 Tax=Dissoconium aciculare CBS 342.82 TaxID=1314786 RepID=A0A6J3LX67_9PEZI|nr:uncharacterized protein K489DRAFT_51497 [Dissoconium aciculare CBS 342.82]KAF1820258.1 hypothetical protein K489DRAFT_51497 [Dissoconium aciculare CBS 342.82]